MYQPFIESNASSSSAELRAAMNEYGYLFFRALLPEETILDVRRDVLTVLQDAGWLDSSHDMMDGIAAPGIEPKKEGQPEYTAVYRQILRLPRFHAFPEHPALMSIAQKLLDGEVFTHPRRIGRITFPGSGEWATPPHQDYFYIRGSVETYSCWTPLGDCPMTLGGLAVWPGSHRQGYIEHTVSHPGATGGQGVSVDESKAEWHTSDFGIGDALFFRSYTIHKALPNLSPDRLRLSTDNRYQQREDAIDPAATRPHFSEN
jgi:ectoine hydroxylase-related dioxygenase (phytanoyl-CoA dioxygenase family)